MKKTNLRVLGLAMLFSFGMTVNAQIGTPGGGGDVDPGDCDPSCLNGTLNISTGFVQSTATYQTPLAIESNWTLVGVPTGSPATVPGPCFDIVPHPAWSSFPNAQWVSAFQYAGYTPNNCPPGGGGAYEFQKCFCICRDANLTFDFEMLVDDGAEIYLDGTLIASAMAGWQFLWGNRLIFNQSYLLTAGKHCLTVKLYNCGGVAMGFALEGTITGFDMLTPSCCEPLASICGTKILDSNCDGVFNPYYDPGLQGWTIELRDNLGNLIATTVTDPLGNYCFTDLPSGTYTVSEVNQPGWTQTFPASGTHTITVSSGDVGSAYFANCQSTPPPCNVYADYNIQVNDCQVSLTALYPTLPPGTQLVSTHWTFGDGESSNEQNPVHYYDSPGVYTICLTVTFFNGHECCTKTFCQDVQIVTPCEDGCEFDASVNVTLDAAYCAFTFSSNVTYAGMPVTDIFWDFGDGTFGSGSSVIHQFPGPGTYTVCMYLFSTVNGECCFERFCTDVEVRCTPCGSDEGSDGTRGMTIPGNTKNAPDNIKLSDKNIIVLKQNVPNPFAESTVITYNITTDFVKAQMIFTNVDGKIIKTVDITRKGEGQLNVFSDDLSTGTYVYTLVVDGKTIDSKRMVKN